jgi:spore coat protein A, manganese oxidase
MRIKRAFGAEAAICAFAALLAFGTLAWEEALHGLVLPREPSGEGSHFLRDGLLLLPLAMVAAWWGVRPRCGRTLGAGRAAAGVAGAFAALLAPSAAAHGALHSGDRTGVAHADAGVGHSAGAGLVSDGHGLTGALLHGALDAVLALPVAFVLSLGLLAVLGRRRGGAPASLAPRRRLVLMASTVVVAGAAAIVPVSGAVSPDYAKFSMPLTFPPTLTGQNINIEMAQTQEQVLPTGPATTMWTYNGSFPGPIIRRPTGADTNVTFTNNLPASAGSMTVHHHGAHTTEDDDGHPTNFLIAPGASKQYTYPAVENGAAERAAPQWYHDHRDMVTGRNNWMGLVGMFIYDDAFEGALDLPQGEFDLPLMVTDRSFTNPGNQIPYTFDSDGVMGDVILVNGVPQPFHVVGDRRYRLRLYNASNKRDYEFRLSNGQTMKQIGTESGLLPAPVDRTSILLGPAERADVVVDFAGHLNENIVLLNDKAADGPGDRDGEVMRFQVTRDLTDDSTPVPGTLRPLPGVGTPPARTRIWSFDRGAGRWTINGRGFTPSRVEARPLLGSTERWVFRNPSNQVHVVHVHLSDHELVSRSSNGVAVPLPPHEKLKETWYLEPGDEVTVDVRFTDHAGKFVIHCHVLEHEDNAMMAQFQTVTSGSTDGDPAPGGGGTTGGGTTATPRPAPATPLRVSVLSSKRLRRILRRGLRFETLVAADGSRLKAALSARGRRLGSVSRASLRRGEVAITLKLSRRGKARLRRLLADRRRVRAVLKVTVGAATAKTGFTIRR